MVQRSDERSKLATNYGVKTIGQTPRAIYFEVKEGNHANRETKEISMKSESYTPAESIQAAQAEGYIEISSGVYLHSQEKSIVAEQQD